MTLGKATDRRIAMIATLGPEVGDRNHNDVWAHPLREAVFSESGF